jgi:hypothetical protein
MKGRYERPRRNVMIVIDMNKVYATSEIGPDKQAPSVVGLLLKYTQSEEA